MTPHSRGHAAAVSQTKCREKESCLAKADLILYLSASRVSSTASLLILKKIFFKPKIYIGLPIKLIKNCKLMEKKYNLYKAQLQLLMLLSR